MGATVITRQEDLPPLPPLLISLGATREQQSPAERSITPPVITVDKTCCLCLPPRLPNPWWWQELYVPLWNDVRARRRGLGLCHMASRMQCSCLQSSSKRLCVYSLQHSAVCKGGAACWDAQGAHMCGHVPAWGVCTETGLSSSLAVSVPDLGHALPLRLSDPFK